MKLLASWATTARPDPRRTTRSAPRGRTIRVRRSSWCELRAGRTARRGMCPTWGSVLPVRTAQYLPRSQPVLRARTARRGGRPRAASAPPAPFVRRRRAGWHASTGTCASPAPLRTLCSALRGRTAWPLPSRSCAPCPGSTARQERAPTTCAWQDSIAKHRQASLQRVRQGTTVRRARRPMTLCEAGNYCPTPSEQLVCPSGSFCKAGVTRATEEAEERDRNKFTNADVASSAAEVLSAGV